MTDKERKRSLPFNEKREKRCFPDEKVVFSFDEINPEDSNLFGTKGYNLALMHQAGLPIPQGFCISTKAFDEYLEARNNGQLDEFGLPIRLSLEIRDLYTRELFNRNVAVRSSANVEDMETASSAGVYGTDLNLDNVSRILSSIERCFDSLNNPEAISYRQKRGIDTEAKMAIVIQEMVPADSAGVLFTRDPIDGSSDQMVINSIFGLGELLVCGELTGDTFYYDTTDDNVSADIGQKEAMLTKDGRVTLTPQKQAEPSLTEKQVRQLCDYGSQIEAIFDHPQDIEFAVCHDQIFILQARPITIPEVTSKHNEKEMEEMYIAQERRRLAYRLRQLHQSGRLEHHPAILTDSNISELLPNPTPMAFGIFNYIFSEAGAIQTGRRQMGYQIGTETDKGFYELVAGHPYVNLEIDAKTFNVGFPLEIGSYIEKVFEDPTLASYPELGLYQQTTTLDELVTKHGATKGSKYYQNYLAFLDKIGNYRVQYLRDFDERLEAEIDAFISAERKLDFSTLTAPQLIEKFYQVLEHMRTVSCVQFVIAARLGFFATERAKSHLVELVGIERADLLLNDLLSGLSASKISGENIAYQKVVKGGMTEAEYMDLYGHMSSNELEISTPRRHEGSNFFARSTSPKAGSDVDSAKNRRLVAETELESLLAEVDPLFAAEVRSDLRCAQTYLPLRETIKYHFTREYDLIRQILLNLQNPLDLAADGIFYLYPREITNALTNPKVKALVAKRRRDRDISKKLENQSRLPSVIIETELGIIGKEMNSTPDHLRGTVVAKTSKGVVGKVIVLDDPENIQFDAILQQIEDSDLPIIIVTRSANLGMDQIISRAGSLIMETGGILAHGACRAREYGIMATVLAGATSYFNENDIIQIDPSGKITILEENHGK